MSSEKVNRRLAALIQDADRLATFLTDLSAEALAADERTLFAVERLLQRITEAVIQIGPAEMERIAPAVPTSRIRAFGNRLRHEYDRIDPSLIYLIATVNVPELRAAALQALEH